MDSEKLIGLYRDWLKVEQNAHSTITRKTSQLNCFLKWIIFRGIALHELTPESTKEFLQEKSSLISVRTQNKQVISEFLEILISKGDLLENPACDIAIEGADPEREYLIPSFEEIEIISKRILESDSLLALRDFCMIELAYGSGARRGEIVLANIEEYDSRSRQIILHGKGRGESKNRLVPVTMAFAKAVSEYLSKRRSIAGALFVSTSGKRVSASTVAQRFAYWTGRNPHIFRHAFATHLHGAGADIDTISKMLGHERPSTTSIYTHISLPILQENLNKMHPRNLSQR